MAQCKGGCGGCCGNCGGCGQTMVLAPEEIDILQRLGQIPFLPVARTASSLDPMYFDEQLQNAKRYSLALQCLEKRGLISIDYDQPLKNGYSADYDPYPIRGSFALTARGQQVVDILEIQGIE